MDRNKGITLIALIITIIVLLILAGIVINLAIGNNNIFNRAKQSKEETTKAELKQEIEFAILEIQIEKNEMGEVLTLDKLVNTEQLLAKKLTGITGEIQNNTIVGEYKDYNYIIKENFEVIIDSKVSGLKMTYSLQPAGYTKSDIIITLEAKAEDGTAINNIVSNDGLNVVDPNKSFKIVQNGLYKFTATDNSGNTKTISVPIQNIDNIEPTAQINVQTTTLFINGNAKADIIVNDAESGIDENRTKWTINTTSTAIGTSESIYTGGTLKQGVNNIETASIPTGGTYYIHVLAIDNAGNSKEYISQSITVKEVYMISTPQDLQNIKNNMSAEYFVENDIDMSGFTFSMIGSDTNRFTGTLDGQGHTISNLTLTGDGMFHTIENADFKNILFKDVNVQSSSYDVGTIAKNSSNQGTCNFEKVGITGSISSSRGNVGSFIGGVPSWGTIKLKNCYARTTLKSGSGYDVGGLIRGYSGNIGVSIENCYWSGTMNATHRVGSLVNSTDNDNQESPSMTAKNSYYNKETFTVSVPKSFSGTGLTTATMRNIANDTNWDFVNDWYIDNEGYPELKF